MDRPARRPAWAARCRAAAGAALVAVLVVPPTGADLSLGRRAEAAPSAAVALAALPTTAPTAPEVGQAEGLRIILDDVEPTVARAGEPLRLIGRVVNDSGEGRRVSRIRALAAWSGLQHRSDIDGWVEGRDQRILGWELGQALVSPVVAAGSEVPFRVTVPAEVLEGIPGERAVLAVELVLEHDGGSEPTSGTEAGTGGQTGGDTGSGTGGDTTESLATRRTVITATREAPVAEPLDVSWVVPLTLPADPDLADPDDATRLAAWHEVVGPGSPALTWLEGLALPGVTWAVDPALLSVQHPTASLLETALAGPGPSAPDGTTPTTEPPATEEPASGENGPGGTTEATTAEPTGASTGTSPTGAGTTTAPGQADEAAGDPAAQTTGPSPAVTGEPQESTTGGAGTGGGTDGEGAGGDGSSASPDAGPALTRQLVESEMSRLRSVLAGAQDEQLWWLPMHDPDLAALLAVDPGPSTSATIASAMARTPTGPTQLDRLLERGRDDIAWPVLESVTPAHVTRLDAIWRSRDANRITDDISRGDGQGAGSREADPQGGLSAVVLPRETVTPAREESIGQAAAPLGAPVGVSVLATDSRASALLAASADLAAEAGAGAAAQRLLADTLAAWAEDPGQARSLVIAPPRDATPDAAVLRELGDGVGLAPWLEQQTADALLAQAGQAAPRDLSGGEVDPALLGELADHARLAPSPITTRTARALSGLGSELTGIAQVLDADGGPQAWDSTLAGLWSTRWREDPEAWSEIWQGLRRDADAVRDGVHVNPSTINFFSDEGVMRVTVVNSLPVPVTDLHLQLVPEKSILQVIDQPEPVTVGAGSRATVSFRARAATRGHTAVTTLLSAPNGTSLGDRAAVDVRVQPTGTWIYWVLGGAAGILFVLGAARALRSGPRDLNPTQEQQQ